MPTNADSLAALDERVTACRRCPRLVCWREQAAADPPRRFSGQAYWGRPVPGFGDPQAEIAIVGLAPAAHGANRTGRMFTGDRSGEFLYAALHRVGLANRAESVSRDDGLRLHGVRVTAVVRCAPPANHPTTTERDECLSYLHDELRLLTELRVLVALGGFAWDGALRSLRALGQQIPRPRPRFGHGSEVELGPYALLGSYHPSQQNTFTGKLTQEMLDAVLARARELGRAGPSRRARRGSSGGA